MKRRPFLHLAAGAVATAGSLGGLGVLEGSVDADDADSRAASTRMPVANDARTDDSALSVASVETFEYVVRLNDLGGDPRGQITRFADLEDRERRVARAAIAEGYETNDAPEWLVRFASATPVLEREGTYYRLENTFPTYTVTAEAVAESEFDGKTATYEEYERAVTTDGYVRSSLLEVARREGIELTYVWSDLRAFFEEYDAVRYRGDLVSFSVEVADPGPPYEISGSRVPVDEAVPGSVWNATRAERGVRELVREAGRTNGSYGFDRAPGNLLANLRTHDYVYLGDTFYTAYVEKEESVPASVSATFRGERLRLALRNEGEAELRVTTGAPRPFGILRCHPAGDPDTHRLLWTDAYVRSDHVRTAGRDVRTVADVALTSTVGPGEAVSETYAVPADLSPGDYVVAGSVGVRTDGRNPTVRYRTVFSVE